MKKTIISLFILCMTTCFIYSQEVSTGGRQALQFYIINGYAVSYKFPSKGILNYRINLDFGAHYGDVLGENTGYSYRTEQKSIGRNLSITLTPQVYVYFLSTNYAKMYAGGGAFINYLYNKNTTDGTYNFNTGSSSDIQKISSYSFGLSALIGVETELAKHISLFAESQINGGKRWSESKHFSHHSDGLQYWSNSTIKNWYAEYSDIRIGLGVYF
ncbi:MAG: hypothetical protein Q8903_08170 [Bacteroidota bacterium]|nr:hypothetical protein [Bacteroidota bacterium]